ncbi:MgtC/SapB family protein [Pseudoalteromonas sp. OOF1S-7]|uniref:MgtC/SapB family protein n=1 Tax=Pseudoalteromonas sp. OOF1S-7 TaxID=2917757 RepID=UPI001EF6D16B|nr:MgtC/SapB family protein [Pseudoalteromonas sp. OOF1S-7]MCG7537375.1 MgtC/SapB family protein [Pseudoalteromonas sp. OOF1S-7]
MSGVDFDLIIYHLFKIGVAFILTLPMAVNREKKSDSAGLRTFPLVTIACCAFVLVGIDVFEQGDAQARVVYGVITGIGFIGGGAIYKCDRHIEGTATAAGIWLTGAIGISVAYSRYEIAIVLSLTSYCVFKLLEHYKVKAQPVQGSDHV